jgi:sec-independent protein translocase protein TatA
MPNLGTSEIIIIALVIVVLFGSKKLPDAARSIGRSLRIFKAETKGLRNDEETAQQPAASAAPAAAPAPLPIAPPPPATAPAQPPSAQAPVQTGTGAASSGNDARPANSDRR